MDWRGNSLQNKRILVCDDCYDVPQEQLRVILLPPDPIPIRDPRPNYGGLTSEREMIAETRAFGLGGEASDFIADINGASLDSGAFGFFGSPADMTSPIDRYDMPGAYGVFQMLGSTLFSFYGRNAVAETGALTFAGQTAVLNFQPPMMFNVEGSFGFAGLSATLTKAFSLPLWTETFLLDENGDPVVDEDDNLVYAQLPHRFNFAGQPALLDKSGTFPTYGFFFSGEGSIRASKFITNAPGTFGLSGASAWLSVLTVVGSGSPLGLLMAITGASAGGESGLNLLPDADNHSVWIGATGFTGSQEDRLGGSTAESWVEHSGAGNNRYAEIPTVSLGAGRYIAEIYYKQIPGSDPNRQLEMDILTSGTLSSGAWIYGDKDGNIITTDFDGSWTVHSATITPSANGYYRMAIDFTTTDANVMMYIANCAIPDVGSYVGDGVSGWLIDGHGIYAVI